MRLSSLQRYILKYCLENQGAAMQKKDLVAYYSHKKIKKEIVTNDITKSVERLIERELITGFGKKTARKWFITEVSLTPKGKRTAKTLFGKQQKLPLKKSLNH